MAEYVQCPRCPMSGEPHFHERIVWAGTKWFILGPAEHAPLPPGHRVVAQSSPDPMLRCRDEAHHAPDCECALLFDVP